jgi:hypothetical protein
LIMGAAFTRIPNYESYNRSNSSQSFVTEGTPGLIIPDSIKHKLTHRSITMLHRRNI